MLDLSLFSHFVSDSQAKACVRMFVVLTWLIEVRPLVLPLPVSAIVPEVLYQMRTAVRLVSVFLREYVTCSAVVYTVVMVTRVMTTVAQHVTVNLLRV